MKARAREVPLVAALLALVAVAFFVLPLIGLLRRVPWSGLWNALSEPAAGSDPASMATMAVEAGDDYVLNGSTVQFSVQRRSTSS